MLKGEIFMADKCVVRNARYRRGGLNKRERHNERKNADYQNEDIIKERAEFNVHFKRCGENGDDKDSGYAKTFDKMLADKTISTRGLGKDPFIVDELVFDVNSAYFENNGGYEYAKSFFEEAYRCAIEEIGGEQYVLSAVMHADERNKALSDQLGRDVYHYHLHVVYIPVVDKEIYFKKNNKDPELAGKLREVIKQVSHSKKWPKLKQVDENGEVKRNAKGKTILVNSYSLLQDHFFQHMRDSGFMGFERGERGSTAEHLNVLEYKAQQEANRAAAMAAVVEEKQEAAAVLDKQAAKKRKRIKKLDETITAKTKASATVAEVEAIGKPGLLGGFTVSADEINKLKTLAKKSVSADEKVIAMRQRLNAAENERNEMKAQLAAEKKNRPSIKAYLSSFDKFMAALKRAPNRLMQVVEEILRQPPERQEPERATPEQRRSTGIDH
ncbi:MAG: plasmid recombination protein [Clostridiales bacterium]|nr:plasmid recombination protein [Clostridiales bacterium]